MKQINKSKSMLFMGFVMLLNFSCATSKDVWEGEGLKTTTFRRAYANSHIVELENGNFIMIDSGGYEEAPALESDLLANKMDPKKIKAIIITHGHWDHAAGARYFKEKYNIPIIAGLGDKKLLLQGHSDKLCPTSMMAKLRVDDDETLKFVPPEVDYWISEDTSLQELIGIEGTVLPIPSHTPGSLLVIIGPHAFVGDLFRGAVIGSTPEVHFYICNIEENRTYINSFLQTKGVNSINFFTGHFGPTFKRQEVIEAFQ